MKKALKVSIKVGVAIATVALGCLRLGAQELGVTPNQLLTTQLYWRAVPKTPDKPSASAQLSHLLMAYATDSTNAAVRYDLGLLLYEHNPEVGLARAEEALRDLQYEYHLGLVVLRYATMVQDWERVDRISSKLLATHPSDKTLKRLLVEIYSQAGQAEKALNFLQSLEIEEKSSYLVYQETRLLQQLDRAGEAIDLLEKFLEDNPADAMGAVMLVSLYADEGSFDKALPLLQKAQQQHPDNLYLANLAVSIYALQGNDEALSQELLRVATQEGSDPIAIQGLLDAARRSTSNLTQLLPTLIELEQKLIEFYPEVDQLALSLANDYFLQSDTVQGEQVLRQLVTGGTELPSPYYYFLEQSAKAEDLEGLRSVASKGLEALPKEGLFHFYMALVEVNSGDTVAYNKQIDTALSLVPEEDRMYGQLALMRGEIAMQQDNWAEAVPYFEKAVEKGVPMAYNNYAYFLTSYGTKEDLNRAEELSRQAVQFDSENPSYLDTYAWVLYLKGAYPLARIYMERAIKYGTEGEREVDPVYYEHYADILIALEEYGEALKALAQAVSKTPEKEVEALQKLEHKIKETKKSREAYEAE